MHKELTDLREQLATEVRTRRLVVVNEDGVESITGEVFSQWAELRVLCATDGTADHSSWEDLERSTDSGMILDSDGL